MDEAEMETFMRLIYVKLADMKASAMEGFRSIKNPKERKKAENRFDEQYAETRELAERALALAVGDVGIVASVEAPAVEEMLEHLTSEVEDYIIESKKAFEQLNEAIEEGGGGDDGRFKRSKRLVDRMEPDWWAILRKRMKDLRENRTGADLERFDTRFYAVAEVTNSILKLQLELLESHDVESEGSIAGRKCAHDAIGARCSITYLMGRLDEELESEPARKRPATTSTD